MRDNQIVPVSMPNTIRMLNRMMKFRGLPETNILVAMPYSEPIQVIVRVV